MNRFSESYLDEVVETQGALFDLFADSRPECDTADFITAYMRSRTRAEIDAGQAYVATMPPDRLLERFLSEGYVPRPGERLRGFAVNWIGQFYALYQWERAMPSRDVVEAVTPDFLVKAYPGLHDLELDLAVAKVSGCVAREG